MDTKFLRGQCVCSRPGLGFPFQASTLSPVPDSPLVTDLLSYSACRGFWDQRRLRSLGQCTHSTVQQEVTFPQRPLTGPPLPPPPHPRPALRWLFPLSLGVSTQALGANLCLVILPITSPSLAWLVGAQRTGRWVGAQLTFAKRMNE